MSKERQLEGRDEYFCLGLTRGVIRLRQLRNRSVANVRVSRLKPFR